MLSYYRQMAEKIESAYQASGHSLGWRLLYSPAEVLDHADVAFIGLNPGGSECPINHAKFAMASGSAYVSESWNGYDRGASPLQKEVRSIFERLGASPEKVLAGNLVPFRSPSWSKLQDRRGALEFSRRLWTEILKNAQPSLVIAMGGVVRDEVANILGITKLDQMPTGWGNITASRGKNREANFIGLPHLSRFRIMNRPNSVEHLNALFLSATPS